MLTTKPPTEPRPFIVTRAFWFAGSVREVGSRVDLVPSQGAELQAAGKVQPAPAESAPAAEPAAPAPKRARKNASTA